MTIISTRDYTPKMHAHDKPANPIPHLLEIRNIPVDIMATGEAFVAIAKAPHADALVQFTFPAIFVNCTPDFAPKPGTEAVTGYINNDEATFHGGNFRHKLKDFKDIGFSFHDLDDDGFGYFSEYEARIYLKLRKARTSTTIARVKTYLLINMVKQELQDNGYTLQQAHYTKA